MPRKAFTAGFLVLLVTSLGLTGCASNASSAPASDTATHTRDWDPGNYLEKYTRSLPGTQFESPADIINARDWDPANYLEKYTRNHPGTQFESPADIINTRDWDPTNYLEKYTR